VVLTKLFNWKMITGEMGIQSLFSGAILHRLNLGETVNGLSKSNLWLQVIAISIRSCVEHGRKFGWCYCILSTELLFSLAHALYT
jgi:hypothetical protein